MAASVKAWKLNTPDVTLHAGADTAAEIAIRPLWHSPSAKK